MIFGVAGGLLAAAAATSPLWMRDVAVGSGDADRRAPGAYGSADALAVLGFPRVEREKSVYVSPLVVSACTVKLAFSGSVASMEPLRSSSVMVPRVGAAVRSIRSILLVTAMSPARRSRLTLRLLRGQHHRAQHLVGGDARSADLGLAVQADELQVGAAGVEADGAVDVLQVRGAEELAG